MKRDQVQLGSVYACRVSGRVVPVRVVDRLRSGGYRATNTRTGKPIRVKSPEKLLYPTVPFEPTQLRDVKKIAAGDVD